MSVLLKLLTLLQRFDCQKKKRTQKKKCFAAWWWKYKCKWQSNKYNHFNRTHINILLNKKCKYYKKKRQTIIHVWLVSFHWKKIDKYVPYQNIKINSLKKNNRSHRHRLIRCIHLNAFIRKNIILLSCLNELFVMLKVI